jgi:serine acetyltransferase
VAEGAMIGADAIVSRDAPPDARVVGINRIVRSGSRVPRKKMFTGFGRLAQAEKRRRFSCLS